MIGEVGILNRSLGIELGKEYLVTIWTTEGETSTMTMGCVDGSAINGSTMPEGCKLLLWIEDASIYFIIDNANVVNEEIVYSENNAIIPIISDNVYKMVIDGLPNSNQTYDRIVTKKIDSKYLPEVDQNYKPNSTNAQSGKAVAAAVQAVQNKIPSNYISGIYTSTTMGD
jgi:hypothetical protein